MGACAGAARHRVNLLAFKWPWPSDYTRIELGMQLAPGLLLGEPLLSDPNSARVPFVCGVYVCVHIYKPFIFCARIGRARTRAALNAI